MRNKIAGAGSFYRMVTERTRHVSKYTGGGSPEIARHMRAQVGANTGLVACETIIRATMEQIAREDAFVNPAGKP